MSPLAQCLYFSVIHVAAWLAPETQFPELLEAELSPLALCQLLPVIYAKTLLAPASATLSHLNASTPHTPLQPCNLYLPQAPSHCPGTPDHASILCITSPPPEVQPNLPLFCSTPLTPVTTIRPAPDLPPQFTWTFSHQLECSRPQSVILCSTACNKVFCAVQDTTVGNYGRDPQDTDVHLLKQTHCHLPFSLPKAHSMVMQA